jgi:hypothetical protein
VDTSTDEGVTMADLTRRKLLRGGLAATAAGVTLGEAHRRLFAGWGVTVPAGWCPTVGAGDTSWAAASDHCPAYSASGRLPLRRRGVVVDRRGRARRVVATRERWDPNRALWWAHTGGGGGNFGIVTRYWFRTPGARSDDPSRLLPTPPGGLAVRRALQ